MECLENGNRLDEERCSGARNSSPMYEHEHPVMNGGKVFMTLAWNGTNCIP